MLVSIILPTEEVLRCQALNSTLLWSMKRCVQTTLRKRDKPAGQVHLKPMLRPNKELKFSHLEDKDLKLNSRNSSKRRLSMTSSKTPLLQEWTLIS
jgi:hypothetical protein